METLPTRYATEEERRELDARARRGETVVPGGKGGKSLVAQEHLAEGMDKSVITITDLRRKRGGHRRREQLGIQGYKELGKNGGETRKRQLGSEGYRELGRIGGLVNSRIHGYASKIAQPIDTGFIFDSGLIFESGPLFVPTPASSLLPVPAPAPIPADCLTDNAPAMTFGYLDDIVGDCGDFSSASDGDCAAN